jgi:hypothetical protein
MNMKMLLLFLLPAALVSQCLATTYTLNTGSNVGAALTAAHAGDTVLLGAGTYNFGSPVTIPSGVTLAGVSPNSSHMIFNIAGGGTTSYGIVINGNASNVTIENLDLVSNHGLISMAGGSGSYTNITISYNNLQYGPGKLPDGTLVFGIFGTLTNNNLQLTHNYFHDSTALSSRNWCIWFAQNSNIDYNLFYNIEDGGQICDCGQNLSFSHNYGTLIHRMGQEGGLSAGSTMTINGNVFYNWEGPYDDSDALSIVGVSGAIHYTNNFFKASIAPGSSFSAPDPGGTYRFGMAIEGTGEPAYVSGNTFVGTWACDYSSTMVNAQVSNNTVWGGALWGDFDGEPGPYGYGSVIASNNTMYSSSNGAPNPPANTFAGPNPSGLSASTVVATPVTSGGGAKTTGGSLSGSEVSAGSSYTLTTLGSTDWAHWGRNGVYGNFDHKASGGSQISNVMIVGSGSYGAYHNTGRDVSWSDGTPTSSDSGDTGYIWANNALGAGYSFSVPASTTQHTIYAYLGGYSSGGSLTAHLSDGSAVDYVVGGSGSSFYTNLVAIKFNAASNGQTLTLTYTKTQNITSSGGSVDLIAAWLQ